MAELDRKTYSATLVVTDGDSKVTVGTGKCAWASEAIEALTALVIRLGLDRERTRDG